MAKVRKRAAIEARVSPGCTLYVNDCAGAGMTAAGVLPEAAGRADESGAGVPAGMSAGVPPAVVRGASVGTIVAN